MHSETYSNYQNKSLICLTQTSKIRKQCLKIITSTWFEKASIFFITVNLIILAMYRPCDEASGNCHSKLKCLFLESLNLTIFGFFFLEMIIKIVAMGMFGKKSYFGDLWNILDFIIIIISVLEYAFLQIEIDMTPVRMVRVLRPLRAINRISSLRIVVMLLFEILPMLRDIFILCLVVFWLFGIVAVQLWKGVLLNRCFLNYNHPHIQKYLLLNNTFLPHAYYQPAYKENFICSQHSGLLKCDLIPALTQHGHECNQSVDEFLKLNQKHDSLYSCINWNAYYTECKPSKENPFKNSISFDNIGYAGVTIFQIISLTEWSNIMYIVQEAHSFLDWIFFVILIIIGSFFLTKLCRVVIVTKFLEIKNRETSLQLERENQTRMKENEMSYLKIKSWSDIVDMVETYLRQMNLNEFLQSISYKGKYPKDGDKSKFEKVRLEIEITAPLATPEDSFVSNLSRESICANNHDLRTASRSYYQLKSIRFSIERDSSLSSMQNSIQAVVKSPIFIHGLQSIIIFNTLLMCTEHHNQPKWLNTTIECFNIFLASMFTIDILCNITIHGFFKYIKCPFNLCDLMIGAIGLLEMMYLLTSASTNALSTILRLFRFLRLVKLVRFMPSLRKNFVVMMKAVENVASFFLLLALFIFIFSILGMNLFGCKFCKTLDDGTRVCDRKNFNTFLWSTVTVFQILTQDNWNIVLYNGMSTLSPYASLYFIALLTFGNYILFNLLLAILFEGFIIKTNNEEEENASQVMKRAFIKRKHTRRCIIHRQETNKFGVRLGRFCEIRMCKSRIDWSLFILPDACFIRRWCDSIIESTIFQYLILASIGLNSFTLALEKPNMDPTRYTAIFLAWTNYIFLIIFTLELVLKILAYGFIFGKNAYLKDTWNIIDLIFVLTSITNFILLHFYNSTSKETRKLLSLFETLKPLRIISRTTALKNLIETLIFSLKNIGNVFLLTMSFFIFYGVIGVQLFKGKMYYCSGESVRHVLTKNECLANATQNNEWINSKFNFDHIGAALMALFVLTNKDGWSEIMYSGIDAVGVDRQPIENHNEWMLIYFISFLLLVGFLMSNLFVGVIIDSFHKHHKPTASEISKITTQSLFSNAPSGNYERIDCAIMRKYVRALCKNTHFDQFIGFVILSSIVLLSLEHYDMNATVQRVFSILNLAITLIFFMEALCRIVAEGLVQYFKKKWNLFDISVLALAIIQIFIEFSNSNLVDSTIIKLLKIIRIVRVLKLIKMASGIRNLINTVILALPQVKTLILLFFLLYFTFATVGVKLFGHIKCDDLREQCNGINNAHAHFQNFGMAFLTLFRIATIDKWSAIMKDVVNHKSICESSDGLCLTSIVAMIYFIVYIILAQYVILNIVVAVLLKRLEELSNFEKQITSQQSNHVELNEFK